MELFPEPGEEEQKELEQIVGRYPLLTKEQLRECASNEALPDGEEPRSLASKLRTPTQEAEPPATALPTGGLSHQGVSKDERKTTIASPQPPLRISADCGHGSAGYKAPPGPRGDTKATPFSHEPANPRRRKRSRTRSSGTSRCGSSSRPGPGDDSYAGCPSLDALSGAIQRYSTSIQGSQEVDGQGILVQLKDPSKVDRIVRPRHNVRETSNRRPSPPGDKEHREARGPAKETKAGELDG